MPKYIMNIGSYLKDMPDKIPDQYLDIVYEMVQEAIDNTDPIGKTTDQIFGEIFTRIRTEFSVYNRHPEIKKIFPHRLKYLGQTGSGKQLNSIINELYENKNNDIVKNLELCTIMMNNCVSNAKDVNNASESIFSTLEQIDEDLHGEVYV